MIKNNFIMAQTCLDTKITERTIDQFCDYFAYTLKQGYWLGWLTRLEQLRACLLLSEQTGRPLASKLQKELAGFTFGGEPMEKKDWLDFNELANKNIKEFNK